MGLKEHFSFVVGPMQLWFARCSHVTKQLVLSFILLCKLFAYSFICMVIFFIVELGVWFILLLSWQWLQSFKPNQGWTAWCCTNLGIWPIQLFLGKCFNPLSKGKAALLAAVLSWAFKPYNSFFTKVAILWTMAWLNCLLLCWVGYLNPNQRQHPGSLSMFHLFSFHLLFFTQKIKSSVGCAKFLVWVAHTLFPVH